MCGVLRNGRGTKVLVYLLDTALVVGRQVSRPGIGKVCLTMSMSIFYKD